MVHRSDFPADFVWGTATAAYQVEGAAAEDGRGPSIWDTLARRPGAIADGSNGDVADDHYHRLAEDVALMADLGVTAYRFSLSWSRIIPTGSGQVNQAGLDLYQRLVDELRDRGIAPYATLYHWDLPQPLEDAGGWLERDTAHRFADLATTAARGLDGVASWITLNEPWCSAFLGYGSGVHAPGRQEGARSAHAAHHLLLGHGLAVDALRAETSGGPVGVTLNLYSVEPASGSDADRDAARRVDGLQNRFFLEPVLTGQYPADVLADLGEQEWFAAQPAGDLEQIARPIDFLGVNYYSRHTVAAPDGSHGGFGPAFPGSEDVRTVDTGAPVTEMGWPVVPEGLVDVLEQAHRYAPQLPLLVTENGSAYPDQVGPNGQVDDPERLDYLVRHIEACRTARDRGVPLAGYFTWSLLDNWEWAFGFSRRFGITHVDYETQERTVKSSGRWFQGFLRGEEGTPAPGTGARP